MEAISPTNRHRSVRCAVLCLLIGWFSLTQAWAAVGRTAGAFDVSASGQASYSIPIVVPPGTHGLTPCLALAYDHGSSSTLLGVGLWAGVWRFRPLDGDVRERLGGYNAPVNTGILNTNWTGAIAIDYDANGLEDLLVPYSGGTWWVLSGTATGLAAPANTAAPATALAPA